ncbi:MAG: FAD binding domain-containing protein [Actinobacteria bacterium]|nr:FAD binding domain-containing protein [Actinomycetota bacterium]
MKPAPFAYYAPETAAEAVSLLQEHAVDGKVIAGGQSLVPMMNMRLARPTALIDVGRVAELAGIAVEGGVAIGAAAKQARVLREDAVAERLPLLVAALRHVGHPANRARGTIGGSIAHADPAAELPAVAIALGAELVAVGPDGTRTIPADEFFLTYYTTALGPDELLVEVRFPDPGGSRAWGFREVARRHGDFAMAGVAVTASCGAGGTVESARVVLFGIADAPQRAAAAEQRMVGASPADPALAAEVAAAATAGVEFASDPYVSAAYREDAVAALVERAVQESAKTMEEA